MRSQLSIGRKTFKALVVLNIILTFLLLIVASVGIVQFWGIKRATALLNKQPSWDVFDQKFQRRVGQEYDQRTHDQHMLLLRGTEKAYGDLMEVSESFSNVIMRTGGVCLLISGASLFILLRHRTPKSSQSSLS